MSDENPVGAWLAREECTAVFQVLRVIVLRGQASLLRGKPNCSSSKRRKQILFKGFLRIPRHLRAMAGQMER
ncbi:MAG: hypothetical protein AAAB17_04370, partial [Pseudomonas sp.]